MSDVQGGNLAANPDYASAWTQATSGASHEARQAGVAAMERIASGGTSGLPAPSPALAAPANGAAAHKAMYDRVCALPTGAARDAAALELATLAPSSMPVSYFRDKASNTGDYAEAFAIASDASAPSNVRDAAIAAMEASAAAGRLASAEPAPPAVLPGYEPAGSIGEYRPPGIIPHDPDGMARAMADMLAAYIPARLGKLALAEGAATVHYRTGPAAYQRGLADTLAKLTRAVGGDEAAAANRDARECIARMPANLREHATALLVSPQCVIEMARLRRLGAFPPTTA